MIAFLPPASLLPAVPCLVFPPSHNPSPYPRDPDFAVAQNELCCPREGAALCGAAAQQNLGLTHANLLGTGCCNAKPCTAHPQPPLYVCQSASSFRTGCNPVKLLGQEAPRKLSCARSLNNASTALQLLPVCPTLPGPLSPPPSPACN